MRGALALSKHTVDLAHQPCGGIAPEDCGQQPVKIWSHDPTGDAAIGTYQFDDVPRERREFGTNDLRVENGAEGMLEFGPIATANVSQNIADVPRAGEIPPQCGRPIR